MSLLTGLTLRKAGRLVPEVEHAGFDTDGNPGKRAASANNASLERRATVENFPELLSYPNITHHLMKTADEKWRAHTSPHAEIS